MRKRYAYLIFGILFSVQSCNEHRAELENDQIEVAMRKIGHEVLLSSYDSLSIVKPIVNEGGSYRIQFGSNFSFLPDHLVNVIDSIIKQDLPYENYLVKIENCESKEVIYSYEINKLNQFDDVACKTRVQPEACYEVVVQFIHEKQENIGVISLIFLLIGLVGIGSYFYNKRNFKANKDAIKIGEYLYDAKKMLLIRKEKTIELTSKESELLKILYESANETVERDIILNKVWGDEGDYVGRTLDVYISKLRKKLEGDDSIQIKNIRGIGYKLIVAI